MASLVFQDLCLRISAMFPGSILYQQIAHNFSVFSKLHKISFEIISNPFQILQIFFFKFENGFGNAH